MQNDARTPQLIGEDAMYPYRVFISYSRDDADVAGRVKARLEEIGARPMSDVDLPEGFEFADEIRKRISYAHVFVTVLTARSKDRPWVHQELGFAMGLGVPILPLALDELPKGMAEQIEAVRVNPDLDNLAERLRPETLERLVRRSQKAGSATFERADRLRQRTERIVDYAEVLLEDVGPLEIRQRSAFSSFSIPKHGPRHNDWDARDGLRPDPPEVRELLRQEREVMERHARERGCHLIMDPFVPIPQRVAKSDSVRLKHDPKATAVRLRNLCEFLESMPDDKLQVVFHRGEIEGSTVIVGDWLLVEAIVPHHTGGYRQSTFTRHAPTVLARMDAFDREFKDALADANLAGRSSRSAALEAIRQLLGELPGG